MKKLPVICPSCTSALQVSQLSCEECHTQINGNYSLPVFLQLEQTEQEFLLNFITSSGSLKKMASEMGKSYPTVRNMLDDMINKIEKLKKQ